MKRLEQALNDYLRIRRSLGFRLREPEGLLRNFVAFLQAEGASYITRELALRWATQPAKAQPSTWAWRLGMVRRFALWHSAIEPRTEIPPAGLLPHRYRRKPPHIYSDEEIEKRPSPNPTTPLSQRTSRPHLYDPFRFAGGDRNAGERSPGSGPSRMLISSAESFTSGGRSLENRVTYPFMLPPWRL